MNNKGKMDNSIKITLIVVSTVILLVLIGILVYFQINPGNTVSSMGIATVKATPDLVSVYFSVETDGETASEAKDANAEIVEELVSKLISMGFDREDVQTSNFNVYPVYDWESGKQKENGFKATHQITVEMPMDDSEKVGDVVDAGVDAGALVSYINFELTQESQNSYKAEALKLASEDARVKAEAVAAGLDKKLGKLVSVSTSDFGYYPWNVYERAYSSTGAGYAEDAVMAKEAATNIQPGKQTVSASVSVAYKIN